MEMLFYLFGNFCCNAAAIFLLWHNRRLTRRAWEKEKPEMMISRDLQIMLFIGTLLRVYWSLSPPAVWSDEPFFIQWISFFDVLVSPLVWLSVLLFIGRHQHKFTSPPIKWIRWGPLTLTATVMGFLGSSYLPTLETEESWPYADCVVIWNMILDGLAMVPQMYFVAHSEEKAGPEAGHFVGLLCLGRVFRMLFWGIISAHLLLKGDSHGSYLWTFIVPDVIHTGIMGDYLYIWLQKMKRDRFDPFVTDLAVNL